MITTERLRLEELEPRHAVELFAGLSNPRLYEFTDDEPPPSLEWLRARYERLSTRRSPDGRERWLNWAIKAGERYVGYVQATVREAGSALIGYVVFDPGHGYGSEAVGAMLEHLASEAQCVEARASVEPENTRSIALLERLGFEHAGDDVYVRTLTA